MHRSDLYPPMQHKRRDQASHHCSFGGCLLTASFFPVWSHVHVAQNLWINLTRTSNEFALKFSRKIFLELEKKRGLICLGGISMFGKWKEWERKGKTHRQMCKPHTCNRITHKSLWHCCIHFFPWNTWHVQSFICGWGGHKMIRHFNQTNYRVRCPLSISYISSTGRKKFSQITQIHLFILLSCLQHGTTVSSRAM